MRQRLKYKITGDLILHSDYPQEFVSIRWSSFGKKTLSYNRAISFPLESFIGNLFLNQDVIALCGVTIKFNSYTEISFGGKNNVDTCEVILNDYQIDTIDEVMHGAKVLYKKEKDTTT